MIVWGEIRTLSLLGIKELNLKFLFTVTCEIYVQSTFHISNYQVTDLSLWNFFQNIFLSCKLWFTVCFCLFLIIHGILLFQMKLLGQGTFFFSCPCLSGHVHLVPLCVSNVHYMNVVLVLTVIFINMLMCYAGLCS